MSNFLAINDFHIINPASMDSLLNQIYVKRPRSSNITFFLKKYIFLAFFLLKKLFQLKENEFSALEMPGAIKDFYKLGSTSA